MADEADLTVLELVRAELEERGDAELIEVREALHDEVRIVVREASRDHPALYEVSSVPALERTSEGRLRWTYLGDVV